MNASRVQLKLFGVVFAGIMVFGTLGFSLIEGRGLGDALYFTIVTVSTVGYGDVHPVTGPGKVLAAVLIVTGVGAFLAVIANVTGMVLERRERRYRFQKMNMIIGVFFSELGNSLMSVFSESDPDFKAIEKDLIVTGDWTEADFGRVHDRLKGYTCNIDPKEVDLACLSELMAGKRELLIRLMENPTLHEHESFTDLLRAVFHLAEEFDYREDLNTLPQTDRAHLAGDAKRAYRLLVEQWLGYMRFLKDEYPYLFALAMRTNPFDRAASPIVT